MNIPVDPLIAHSTASSERSALRINTLTTPLDRLRLGFGLILLFWMVAAAIWPISGMVVPWDSKNHFYPMLRYLGAALASGEWPLWNPYHFSGHPSVADPQSLLFTPTMVLFAWLVPSPSMGLFDLVVFAHFLPGALALPVYFRLRGWHVLGAVLAALVFMLGGSASARLQHTGMILSYGYVPLALLLLHLALERRSLVFSLAFALVAALMVVGRDQVAFLSALLLAAYTVHFVATQKVPLAALKALMPYLMTMALAGALMLVIPALLTFQLLSTSSRPSFHFDVAAMGSLPPVSFATLLSGNIFGSLRWTYDDWGPNWQTIAQGTWTDRSTNYLFTGTLPFVLLFWHGIAGGRILTKEFRFFLVAALAAFIYAIGAYTPLFVILFDHVPGIAFYRRPADATFILNVLFALAAGYLLHRYLNEGVSHSHARPARRAVLAAFAVLTVIALVMGAFSYAIAAGKLRETILETGFALGVTALIAWLLWKGGEVLHASQKRFASLVFFLIVGTGAELILRNSASSLNAEPAARYSVFETLPPEQLAGLKILKAEFEARHKAGERPRVEILGLGGAWQNASMVLGLEDTIGYNPLRIAEYERAVGPGENAVDPNLRQFPGTFRGYKSRLANLLGLEYLVLDRPAENLPAHFPRFTQARLLYGKGKMWIYRLPPSAPRAYLATRLIAVEAEEVLQRNGLPDFDRNDEALIDHTVMGDLKGDYGLKDGATDPDPPKGRVTITQYRRTSVMLDAETDRPAILVLHDLFYPGWEVTVNDEPRSLLKLNLLFRGVELPPGRHRITFRFNPLSVDNLLSAASGLLEEDLESEEKEENPAREGLDALPGKPEKRP
jgi:hypothetical protein